MKKPNFFIIGAPKCGTTSMAAWLGEHPHIFMSNPKEPAFFCKDINIPLSIKTLEKYLQIFEDSGNKHLAVGEASAIYLFSQVAVKNILEINPDARFIVMLRNPIDMAISWHGQVLLASPRQIFEDFEEDWKKRYMGKIKLCKFGYLTRDPALLEYGKVCMLGEQVQRLMQTVCVNSILFIVMDDLVSDPLREYQRVLEFLDVPYDGKNKFATHNSAKRVRNKLIQDLLFLVSGLKRLLGIKGSIAFGIFRGVIETYNIKPHKTSALSPEFRRELVEFFKDDVKLLSSLLNRDFSHWL